jgi:NADPH-dependent glutamate synthase beta subunit-like oxidoreductase/NAD(P)H-flavin reductase
VQHALSLAFNLTFPDLYTRDGIVKIDQAFCTFLQNANVDLFNRLMAARAEPEEIDKKAESILLVDVAPYIDDFVGELFNIRLEIQALAATHQRLAPLFAVRRLFVQRTAAKKYTAEQAATFDSKALAEKLGLTLPLNELAYATKVQAWQGDEATNAENLEIAAQYAAWAIHTEHGRESAKVGVLFRMPKKLDFQNLVPVETFTRHGVTMMRLPEHEWRARHGFSLTDEGASLEGALGEANYCIWCHNQEKDSCSKGLKDKKTGEFQKSTFGVTLAGCPLEEKISEMNFTKAEGHSLGALAIVCVDNPMTAGTGHRICNDCMKACIYQKQDAVNIPQVETRTLKDVLNLPWGFEIYSLLTRWNPLNISRPVPKPETGYKVLVVGLGPSGYTLSHHLLNDGHTVAAVDGLKIEPLAPEISGVDALGNRKPFQPIYSIEMLFDDLDNRIVGGFGGVAEYGITVRWNKNYLKIIRLLLERRAAFAMAGGVRFGSTITIDSALKMGFDHIALCAGAGKPTFIQMPNALAKGVRQASDFLMALQLSGAAKQDSIANLQVRLPVVVIGGGLTAIDTATESLAYYPQQVEKFLHRYETLVAEKGVEAVRSGWNAEETAIADEFIAHAKQIRLERQKSSPNVAKLLQSWGGATLAYRRKLVEAPCYTLNHEEVHLALEEGINFAECLSPHAIEVDEFQSATAIQLKKTDTGEIVTLPAKTILIAAGTQPNTVLAREEMTRAIELDGKYFQAVDENGAVVRPQKLSKPDVVNVLMHRLKDARFLSFFGDLHPSFAGNVVKAMGSAKQGYPVVSSILTKRPPTIISGAELLHLFNEELRSVVHAVHRLTPNIIEIVVHAPKAAREFAPGQFYRLQNFETFAPLVDNTRLAMEGLALTGASVDKEKGLLSTIVLEMGGSSDLCASLKVGEPVVLMGPTGTPTHIPHNSTVLLAGGGLGNAVLFSIGQAARAANSRVVYFAGYKKLQDRYKVEQIEAAADVIVWCCDESPAFTPTRPQDKTFVGNIVLAMKAYAEGALGEAPIKIEDVEHLIAIGSDRMMAAVGYARHGVLKPYFNPKHVAIGSINSPMQCMMKEICAQCLQPHKDPITGEETVVFSCFNQDQELDKVDFQGLRTRLEQNSIQEKLTAQWLKKCRARMERAAII